MKIIFDDKQKENVEKALDSAIYKRWFDGITKSFHVESIIIHNVFMFGNRVGFIVVEAKAKYQDKPVPGIAFLRGDSVSIMPVFHVYDKTGSFVETYTAVVTEPRIPVARNRQTSLPAGMVDGDTVACAALKELGEEIGTEIKINAEDLINLGRFPLSCGGCDEYMNLVAFYYDLDMETFEKLNGRNTGEGDHENILVTLIPINKLLEVPNLDARSALSYLLWKTKE